MKTYHFIIALCLMVYGKLYSQQNTTVKNFLIPYRYKNLWGYCDTLGNIKIIPEYDTVEFDYSSNHLPVIKNKKRTLLDENGKPIIGFYDNYGHLESGTGYWVLNNGKAGIITSQGDTIVPIIYDKLFYTHHFIEYQKEVAQIIGKISNRYFLISLKDMYHNPLSKAASTEIPALSKNPLALWEHDSKSDFPPEIEPLFDSEQVLYTLTAERQQNIQQIFDVDSVDKEPLQILKLGEAVPFYRVYKQSKTGLWNNNHFIYPKYEVIKKGSYYETSFLAKLDNKFGIINEKDKALSPFKYDNIENTDWGSFIITMGHKSGVLILHNLYPEIKCVYDKVELFRMLTINENWRFALFKILKKGKEGFVGENGIEYFKD